MHFPLLSYNTPMYFVSIRGENNKTKTKPIIVGVFCSLRVIDRTPRTFGSGSSCFEALVHYVLNAC